MKKKSSTIISNKKAKYNYEILDTFEAGIALQGTEVKSLKEHSGSLQESYITNKKGELWLINSSIPPYSHGNLYNHEEKRDRKLLMHRSQIQKLSKEIQEKGIALIALSLYVKNGIIKLQIALAKGKKIYDKRKKIEEKEIKKSLKDLY